MNGKFRARKLVVNDEGEFTHRCLDCGYSTAFQYEDYCDAGCKVLVTECVTCNLLRERTIKD